MDNVQIINITKFYWSWSWAN